MPDPTRDLSGPTHLELELPGSPVSLGFAVAGPLIYLVATNRASRWPTLVLRQGTANLRIGERTVRGSVELITDPAEKARILELFRTRYGERDFQRWYANAARVLLVTPVAPGPPSDPRDQYYRWLTAEFDNVAPDYDHHITGNRMNRLLRERSLAELRRAFADARRLLEIGCGSGMETLPLLEEGHEVVCLDISARMLDVVREKARKAGVTERVETVCLRASDLPKFLTERGPGAFDGVYSTYGALNCESDLGPISESLAGLLRGGGRFVAGVYNRWCLFELVGYGLTGRWSRAVGRTQSPIPVGSSRFCVDVYALSVPEFAQLFSPWFSVDRVEGVPVFLPPSDLVGYADRFSRRFEQLARGDRAIGVHWPFHSLGDHFLMTLRRREGPPPRRP